MRISVALRSFSIAAVTRPVGSSSEVARSWAPSSWISDIASEHRRVGLRLLDREEGGAQALLQLLVGLRQAGVPGPDRFVRTAVERRGEALLGLAELLPGRLDRRLSLGDLSERGVHGRSDLGDTGHPCCLLRCGTWPGTADPVPLTPDYCPLRTVLPARALFARRHLPYDRR